MRGWVRYKKKSWRRLIKRLHSKRFYQLVLFIFPIPLSFSLSLFLPPLPPYEPRKLLLGPCTRFAVTNCFGTWLVRTGGAAAVAVMRPDDGWMRQLGGSWQTMLQGCLPCPPSHCLASTAPGNCLASTESARSVICRWEGRGWTQGENKLFGHPSLWVYRGLRAICTNVFDCKRKGKKMK